MKDVKTASGQTSLYDISWQVTESEYRKGEGLSYSTLSRFDREGFSKLDSLFDPISGPFLTFGSLVDVLLTGDKKELDDNFLIASFPPIAPSQLDLVEYLFKHNSDKYNTLNDIPNKIVIEATEVVGFQTNWKPETRAKVIKEKASEYYNLKHLALGKEIVDHNMFSDAQETAHVLKTHENTRWFFMEDDDPQYERLYQLKFRGEYNGIPIRCMADEIIVDHYNKIVYPIDLKTSGKPEYDFPGSFLHWRYYIQAQMYWYIIRQNMDKSPIYKDYTLADYTFLIISNGTRNPLKWTYEDTQKTETLYYGKNKQIECRNWREILEELHYYLTVKPNVPIGISSLNSVTDILNKHY